MFRAESRDPKTQQRTRFPIWAAGLSQGEEQLPGSLEDDTIRLAARLDHYLARRIGLELTVLYPDQGDPLQSWISWNALWGTEYDDRSDVTGTLSEASSTPCVRFRRPTPAAAFSASDEESNKFIELVTASGPRLGVYPDRRLIELEVALDRWRPFDVPGY